MNDFEKNILRLVEEGREIQKKEVSLRAEQQLFTEKMAGFFKENGVPENFSLPELALLAIRKSRDLIKL